jgi:hypothetical protein
MIGRATEDGFDSPARWSRIELKGKVEIEYSSTNQSRK